MANPQNPNQQQQKNTTVKQNPGQRPDQTNFSNKDKQQGKNTKSEDWR